MNEFCRHLRSKKMYVRETTEETFAEHEDGMASPCYFWCNLTQTVIGKDDRPAHKNTCNDSRKCFEG